ncbi:MAG: hypothetical protein HND58_18605 [Planctomycetota bacterium]|nr:MAG: hypothetical protein HND58_18605 [Planctomycetota bacterium]
MLGYERLKQADARGAAEAFFRVVHAGMCEADVADAYVGLGAICNLVEPSFDGGHHGLGFFALAMVHDPSNMDAATNIVRTFSSDARSGHTDRRLRDWASRKLGQIDEQAPNSTE